MSMYEDPGLKDGNRHSYLDQLAESIQHWEDHHVAPDLMTFISFTGLRDPGKTGNGRTHHLDVYTAHFTTALCGVSLLGVKIEIICYHINWTVIIIITLLPPS